MKQIRTRKPSYFIKVHVSFWILYLGRWSIFCAFYINRIYFFNWVGSTSYLNQLGWLTQLEASLGGFDAWIGFRGGSFRWNIFFWGVVREIEEVRWYKKEGVNKTSHLSKWSYRTQYFYMCFWNMFEITWISILWIVIRWIFQCSLSTHS